MFFLVLNSFLLCNVHRRTVPQLCDQLLYVTVRASCVENIKLRGNGAGVDFAPPRSASSVIHRVRVPPRRRRVLMFVGISQIPSLLYLDRIHDPTKTVKSLYKTKYNGIRSGCLSTFVVRRQHCNITYVSCVCSVRSSRIGHSVAADWTSVPCLRWGIRKMFRCRCRRCTAERSHAQAALYS